MHEIDHTVACLTKRGLCYLILTRLVFTIVAGCISTINCACRTSGVEKMPVGPRGLSVFVLSFMV